MPLQNQVREFDPTSTSLARLQARREELTKERQGVCVLIVDLQRDQDLGEINRLTTALERQLRKANTNFEYANVAQLTLAISELRGKQRRFGSRLRALMAEKRRLEGAVEPLGQLIRKMERPMPTASHNGQVPSWLVRFADIDVKHRSEGKIRAKKEDSGKKKKNPLRASQKRVRPNAVDAMPAKKK